MRRRDIFLYTMAHSGVRRRFPRIPSGYAVLVRRLDDRPVEELAVTADVGLGGLSFVSRESFGVDAHLELLVTIEGEVVRLRGRVVYENDLADGRSELGVEFLEIQPAHRDLLARIIRAAGGA